MNTQARTLEIVGPERAELTLPDGVVLVSDIYRPAQGGPWPVLLMRQPYGRRIASTVVLAHPAWYAAQGYMVVIQDVRGCGGSGGRFDPFLAEVADGAATVEWARALPGSDGRLGMYGFSYQATTQYLALAGGARPDAIAPAMGSWHPARDWLRIGGVFCTAHAVGWAAQMARQVAARQGDEAAHAALAPDRDWLSLYDYLLSRPDLSQLARWIADEPDLWSTAAPEELLAGTSLDVPVLHVAGLSDFLLRGTLAADAAFRKAAPETTHLILGPWGHIPWNASAGGRRAPGAALSVDKAQVAFFNHYLKGTGPKPPGLHAYDIGLADWHTLADWQEGEGTFLHLSSSGLAAAHLGDGELSGVQSTGWDRLVHDPTRPAPLIGGSVGLPAGFVDRAAPDDRADVSTYQTRPYTKSTRYLGRVRAHLACEADADPAVCAASLSLCAPDESAKVLATGVGLIDETGVFIDLGAICVTVAKGMALRLSVQGSAEPTFAPLPRMGMSSSDASQPATLTVTHAGSHLTLPTQLQEALPA